MTWQDGFDKFMNDERDAGRKVRAFGDPKQAALNEKGRTSCCGAYTSISTDDGVEYCKNCYEAVEVR